MNSQWTRAAFVLLCLNAFAAAAAPKEKLEPDTVILEVGDSKVTARDFDAAMTRFPEGLRDEARAYPSVIMKNIDALFVNRVTAEKARAAGLDKDPLVQQRLKQIQEAYLAQRYLDHLYETAKVPDLSLRAEEIYKADPKKWMTGATSELSDLIVSFAGRTPEMAMERAREAEKRLLAGEDFQGVAAQYTDDRNFAKNRGDLGIVREADLEEPIRKALADVKPGHFTAPIRTSTAVHIMRVRERTPARQRTYDEVKPIIVAEEEERLRKKATDDFLVAVRTNPKNILYPDRLEALRSELDLTRIDRARQEAIEKAQSQAAPETR